MNEIQELRQQIDKIKNDTVILNARITSQSAALNWETRKAREFERALRFATHDRHASLDTIRMAAKTVLEKFQTYHKNGS